MDAANPDAIPDVHVICLARAFETRGAKTIAHMQEALALLGASAERVTRFDAVTPADFRVEDVASVAQVAIIRGRAPRVTHADMSRAEQVACYLSHRTLWQVCADSGRPIVIAEDDARPRLMAARITAAMDLASSLQHSGSSEERVPASEGAADSGNGDGAPPAQVPLVVLLQYHSLFAPYPARREHGSITGGLRVGQFTGLGAYYLTPAAAQLLLKRSLCAGMHVDWFMSTCIAAHDLAVYSVPGANDQMGLDSTLLHSSLWDIVTERLQIYIAMLAVAAACLLAWAVTATFMAAARTRTGK